MADYSDSTTSGGVSQQAAPNKQDRSFLLVQNLSSNEMWIDFGQDAVADACYNVPAGGSFSFERRRLPEVTKKVHILSSGAGDKYIMRDDSFDM